MAGQTLSIKVKVDMPTAGELENQINRSLRGLKDIKTDVKVNMKVGKLGQVKSQLRKALGNERFNVKAGVKVTGMAELNRLATQMEKVRRLAKEPINMKVDTGIKGIDDAVKKAADSGKLMARTRISQHKEMLQQERQFQKEMRQLQGQINKAEQGALKNSGGAQEANYRRDIQRLQQQREELNREYRNWGARNGFSDNQITDRIIAARRRASEGQSSALGRINTNNQVKASAAAYKELTNSIKEAYKAQTRMIDAGPKERAVLQRQTSALRNQIEEQKKSSALLSEDLAKANRLQTQLNTKRDIAEARSADSLRNRRRSGSSAGIMATMNVWDMLQQGMYGAAAAVAQMNEVDKAITKVTKVVPDGQRAVNRWKKNIYRDASEVGKTAPEFASAVEQWATAGYNLKQSNRLAKASVMGSFVGEVPVNDMVKYMSVPMKAFQKEGLKSTDIINAMNQVSNKHAIEMDDLGQAYQKASSTVAATGTSFSQLTGIITAAQEGTRAGGDAIGTAYKTIGSRLAKIGTGLTKQDKTRAAFFKNLGVDLTDSNGKLKSTWQIMDQLGKKWKSMSSKDKNTAAQYAAGANHANIFQATLDNWKTARQAMREADDQKGLGSSGSAYQEMAKQRQSIEFQLAQLKNTWLQFLQNITGGREGISQMLGLLNGFGGVVNKLTANKGFSSLLRWGTIAVGAVTARRAISAMTGSLSNLISNKNQKGAQSLIDKLTGIGTATQKFNDAKKGLRDSWNDFKGKGSSANTSAKSITEKTSVKPDESSSNNIKKETEALKENNTQKRKNADSTRDYADTVRKLGGEFVPEGNQIEENTQKASRHGRVMTRLSKGWKVASSALGLVGAGLGYVGIAMDAVALAGATMQALGIHPMRAMQKVLDPLGESARKTGRYFDKIGDSIVKSSNAINKNSLVNGQMSSDIKAVKSMTDDLGSLEQKDGKYTGDKFERLKNNINAIAKHNGLDFKIRDADSVDVVNNKMQHFKDTLNAVKHQDLSKLVQDTTKSVDGFNKILSTDGLRRAIRATKDYRNAVKDIEKDSRNYLKRRPGETARAYRQRKLKNYEDAVFRPGRANEDFWNSSIGKRNYARAQQAQKNIRATINSLADNLADGTLSTADIKSSDSKTQAFAALGVINNLRSLRGSKDTKQISDTKNQLSSILKALGTSDKTIKSIQNAATKNGYSNGNILKGLLSPGVDKQFIAAWGNIGAKYQSQYKDWANRAAKDQTDLDRYRNKHHNANVTGLVDEDDHIQFDKVASFNNRASYGKKRNNLKAVSIRGPLTATQIAKSTNGLDAAPLDVLNAIGNGTASPSQIATVLNNRKGGKATGGSIVRAIAKITSGNKKNINEAAIRNLQQLADQGTLTQKQVDDALHYQKQNFTKGGRAKTVRGANDVLGRKKTNAGSFSKATSGLKNRDRSRLAQEYAKKGWLSKEAYNDLKKDGNIRGLPSYKRATRGRLEKRNEKREVKQLEDLDRERLEA